MNGFAVKRAIARTLLSSFFLAAFLVFYLRPTASLPSWLSLVAILVIELVAITLGVLIGGTGAAGTVVRTLAISLLFAAIITYIFVPALAVGYETTVTDVFGIEVFGVVLSVLLVRQGSGRVR